MRVSNDMAKASSTRLTEEGFLEENHFQATFNLKRSFSNVELELKLSSTKTSSVIRSCQV